MYNNSFIIITFSCTIATNGKINKAFCFLFTTSLNISTSATKVLPPLVGSAYIKFRLSLIDFKFRHSSCHS